MSVSYSEEEIWKQAETILSLGKYCHLSFATNDEPYGITVNYGFDRKYLYFHSSQKGKKVDIIKTNPKVWFNIYSDQDIYSSDSACHWGTKFRSLMGHGVAELLISEKDKTTGLKAIMKNYSGSADHEFDPKILSHTNIYRIKFKDLTTRKNKIKWED